jgi:protein-disulfide isomerase
MNGYSLKNKISINDHYIGSLEAKINIVEFGDYECPYTKQNQENIDKVIAYYPFEICFGFRHYPITRLHPHSMFAAIAAEAAHLQGRFWDMHHALIETHAELNTENVFNIARHIGLDIKTFLYDIEDNSITNIINKHIQDGIISGVKETPTFFINNHYFKGHLNFEFLKNLIENEIRNFTLSP